jgi:hypothetical protein
LLKRSSKVPGAGLFPRRLSQIAFQSCITAHWRNGLHPFAKARIKISYFSNTKKLNPFIRSARIEMQFWVVLEKRVLGETGFFLNTFLYRQKSISGYGVKPHLLLFFILIFQPRIEIQGLNIGLLPRIKIQG